MRGGWRPLVLVTLVALAGAAGTLLAGAALGMPGADLGSMAWMLFSAALATAAAVAIARPLLARASIRSRFVAVATIGVVVALANLAVFARLMFVSEHDLTLVAVTLLFAMVAGIAAALVIARSSSTEIAQLADVAERLGEGDLKARVGEMPTSPELATLGRTLDEMAERLDTAIERERAVEATRRDLFTAVSHDLRTPLAALQAMVEAIDDGVVDDPPSLRRYAGQMRSSVGALTELVDDLFELAQLDAGAIEQETARVRLEDAVGAALATCRPSAEAKGLAVGTDLTQAAGATCSPRLERVVANLVSNAIRHTPADGTILLQASRSSDGLELIVEDDGEGIPLEDADKIFDPFWRKDAARSGAGSGAGSGLGLTLARRITEALGGRLEVEPPRQLGGARFALTLPTA